MEYLALPVMACAVCRGDRPHEEKDDAVLACAVCGHETPADERRLP